MKRTGSLQKLFIIALLMFLSSAAYSQNPYRLTAGARQVGLAFACVSTEGFWSSFHNQASLGYTEKFSIGINQDSRFGIAELSNKTFAFVIPSGNGALGAVYSYYGYTEYNRHTAGLSYGMMLGPKVSAGIQADFFSTRAAGNYENVHEITFEAGFMYKPFERWSLGLHLFNPLPGSISEHNLPAVIRVGTGFFFSSAFQGMVEVEASNHYAAMLRIGAEYEVYQNLFIRGGFLSEPLGFSFGFGYSGRLFQANLGFITHENLGLSPSLSLVLFFR